MAIDARFYMHDSDKIALQALQAVPGFSQAFKAIMKVWSEKQFRIQNMSRNLRISEKQLSKYYHMLPPICEKLGIDVPELYLELDVNPNAYTAGDTEPFIVLTSGLLESMPDALIPTVLAHECGHIACHHCLYHTIGRFLLSEASMLRNLTEFADLALLPVQVAFYYWMRCSELSADRAAAICDGTSDKVVEMCMRFAGYQKQIDAEADVKEFMNQALEYRQMVADNKWDKTMEFLMFSHVDHPLNAVRALECHEWGQSDRFHKIGYYVHNACAGAPGAYLREVPMTEGAKFYIGKSVDDVAAQLAQLGLCSIRTVKVPQKGLMLKEKQVLRILVNGQEGFERFVWLPVDASVVIEYFGSETEEEVAAAHPGQRRMPEGARRYAGRDYSEVMDELTNAGFRNFLLDAQRKSKKGWLSKEGTVIRVAVNGQTQYEKGEWFPEEATICISYNTYGTEAEAL